MRARQADVAREAGVSARTVSNVINGYPHIRPETAERVRNAIAKLDYVPNGSARTLRTGRVGVIGLAVPDLSLDYFAELATRMTVAAERRGYTLLIDVTAARAERERHMVTGLRPQTIDGLIISPLRLTADEISEAAGGRAVVLLGEWGSGESALTYVGVDNVRAAAAATRHLIEQGRRRVAAIGPVRGRSDGAASQRLDGYSRALVEAGRTVDPDLVAEVSLLSRQEGLRAMEQLLRRPEPPDAVFCFNDLVAVGAAWAVQEAGLQIPADVALIGWDDAPGSRWLRPALSSVRADVEQVVESALDALVAEIESRSPGRRRVLVDHQLKVRASSGGPVERLRDTGELQWSP